MPEQNTVQEILQIIVRDEDFKRHQKDVDGYGRKSQAAFKKAGQAAKRWLQGAAVGAVLALGVAMHQATRRSADYSAAIAETGNLTNATAQEIEHMKRAVLGFYREIPAGSLENYTDAFYNISSSGFAGAAGLRALEQSGKLAAATATDVGTSAAVTTKVLNTYELGIESVVDVSDKLVATVAEAEANLGQLAGALPTVTTAAKSANLELDETLAVTARLTKTSKSADVATTQFAGLLTQLEANAAEIRKLGIDVNDFGLTTGGLIETLFLLDEALEGNQSRLRDYLRDVEAVRGAKALLQAGADELYRSMNAIDESAGETERDFASMREEAKLAGEALRNELNARFIELGDRLLPTVNKALGKTLSLIANIDTLAGLAEHTDMVASLADQYLRLVELTPLRDIPVDLTSLDAVRDQIRVVKDEIEQVEAIVFDPLGGFERGVQSVTLREQLDILHKIEVRLRFRRDLLRQAQDLLEETTEAQEEEAEAVEAVATAATDLSKSIAHAAEQAARLREEAALASDPDIARKLTQQAMAWERIAEARKDLAERPGDPQRGLLPPSAEAAGPRGLDLDVRDLKLVGQEIGLSISYARTQLEKYSRARDDAFGDEARAAAQQEVDIWEAILEGLRPIEGALENAEGAAEEFGRTLVGALDQSLGAITNLLQAFGLIDARMAATLHSVRDAVRGIQDIAKASAAGVSAGAGPWIAAASAVASVIGGLVSAIRKRGEEERRAAEQRAQQTKELAEALERASDRIASAADRWAESARRAEHVSTADQEAARDPARRILSAPGKFRQLENDPQLGHSQRAGILQQARADLLAIDPLLPDIDIEEWLDALGPGGLSLSALEELLAGPFGDALRDILAPVGEFRDTVTGAVREFDVFLRFLGGEATEALKKFIDRLLKIEDLDPELAAKLEEARALDLSTAEGRAQLDAIIAYIAANPAIWGGLTPDQIFEVLGTLQRGSQEAASGASGGGRTTRDVRTARQITEITGSELVAIQREALVVLRDILDAVRRRRASTPIGFGGPRGNLPLWGPPEEEKPPFHDELELIPPKKPPKEPPFIPPKEPGPFGGPRGNLPLWIPTPDPPPIRLPVHVVPAAPLASVGAPTSASGISVSVDSVDANFKGSPTEWSPEEIDDASYLIGRKIVDEIRDRLGTRRHIDRPHR